MELSRQVGPLPRGGPVRASASEAAARQVALRGATLLVLVSIVMAGAPMERAKSGAATAPSAHREARLVATSEPSLAAAVDEQGEEESGAAAVGGPACYQGGAGGRVMLPAGRGECIRAPVRVALLDLPPPLLTS